MTKLDGTAKGGFYCNCKRFKIPIVALGLGEKEDDLEILTQSFASAFVRTN